MTPFILKPAILAGLALWLSIACANNVVDRKTNRLLLKNMFSMSLLQEDGFLGQGLLRRAWRAQNIEHKFLWGIVAVQICIVASLWTSVVLMILAGENPSYGIVALTVSNWSLLAFMGLWFFFLCGGLWFGYWIKTPNVQMFHMLLLIITLLAMILINLQ